MIGRNQVHIYYVTCDGLPVKNVRKFKYNVYLDTLLASDGQPQPHYDVRSRIV